MTVRSSTLAVAAVALATSGSAHAAPIPTSAAPQIGACTMALPALHATVEAQITYAAACRWLTRAGTGWHLLRE